MKLRQRRMAEGMSQLELAVKAGTTPWTVSRYENGKTPRYDEAERLAAALNCRVCDIWPGATMYGAIEIPTPDSVEVQS